MLHLLPWRKKKNEHFHAELRDEHDDFFDRLFGRWMEPVDVQNGLRLFGGLEFDDLDQEVVIRIDVPGFEANELDVFAVGNALTITAEEKPKSKTETGKTKSGKTKYGEAAVERDCRSYRRSVTLPEGVDTDNIEARYHNGILEIHMPKAERAKPKKIAIHT